MHSQRQRQHIPQRDKPPAPEEIRRHIAVVAQDTYLFHGSVEDNLDRWRAQMVAPDGRPATAKLDKRQASGLTINRVDTSGAYTGMGGPMATSTRAIPGYRLLGAVIQGPGDSNLFIKFTGPSKTVAANEKLFEQLLGSFQIEK